MNILWSDRKRWTFLGLPWTFTKYTCTAEKFIVESGIFSTKEEEIRLYRILDLTLDKSSPRLGIKNIKNPRNVKELVSEAVEKERMKKRVSSRELMAAEDEDEE